MTNNTTTAFGVKTTFASADLILIPAPWEATASYAGGAAQGPELIKKASSQLDFFNRSFKACYNRQIYFELEDPAIKSLNQKVRSYAQAVQKNWTEDKILTSADKALCQKVNQASLSFLEGLYKKSLNIFEQGKIPALVGGEHSVSLSLIRLIGEKLKGDYGLLHIDAHADLRESYQGFKHSHASVMYNVLDLPFPPKKLVQVGVRDYSKEEYEYIKSSQHIDCFFDEDIYKNLFNGKNWGEICESIVSALPQKIYVSLDVDGLLWSYAPGTGTPVPGGLSYNQLLYLFAEIKRQKKQLIAFDVVETSSGEKKEQAFSEWNGNVASRLIYWLAGLALWSNNRLK